MYSPFFSTTLRHLSGNFKIPSSRNFLVLGEKLFKRCFLQSSKEVKFFPIREFCKDLNNENLTAQYQANKADEARHSSQTAVIFAVLSKRGLALS